MPYFVVDRVMMALNEQGKAMKDARVLVLGIAYKKDVDDARETPAFKVIEILMDRGAKVDYNDPFIPIAPITRKYKLNRKSVDLTPENLKNYDCVVITTDHSVYDPEFLVKHCRLIVDTRNLIKIKSPNVTGPSRSGSMPRGCVRCPRPRGRTRAPTAAASPPRRWSRPPPCG